MALFEKVRDVIVRELKVPESKVTENATFYGDLGIDSLDFEELMMTLEQEFGIEISEEESQKLEGATGTVDHVVRLVEKKTLAAVF